MLATAAGVTSFAPREGDQTPEDSVEAAEFVACQRLIEACLPTHRLRALLEAVEHSPSRALALDEASLRAAPLGLMEKQVERLRDAANAPLSPRFFARLRALGRVEVLTWRDPAYPTNLAPLTDAPPLLFVRGRLLPEDNFSLAVVGSRRATGYGRTQAERFARTFVQSGLTLVSGGAAGIDTAAHRGALAEEQGRTIVVLGCGVDVVYPAENRRLFEEVVAGGGERGAIISEFALGTRPEPWRFPTRNRIIAGIARATLLVETPDRSGALGTARCAADYGRDVWVVPGPVDTDRSQGGHRLVQDGALLADSPEDVLASLGIVVEGASDSRQVAQAAVASQGKLPLPPDLPIKNKPVAAPKAEIIAVNPPPDLPPDEAALLAALDLTPQHLDVAAGRADLTAPRATVAATLLEMKGLIRRQPGNLFVRSV